MSKKNSLEVIPAGVGTKLVEQKHKPIKLNKSIRDYLTDIVPKIIDDIDEVNIINSLLDTIESRITTEIKVKYDTNDLDILAKYGLVTTIDNAIVYDKDKNRFTNQVNSNSYYSSFKLKEDVTIPKGNDVYNTVSDDVIAMIKAMNITIEERKVNRDKKIKAYTTAIKASKTLDELSKVWVEVDVYFTAYAVDNGLIITESKEILDTIIDDSNKRVARRVKEDS